MRLTALLVGFTSVPEPTGFMESGWIVVCPVNNAALRVPFVDTIECDGVARL